MAAVVREDELIAQAVAGDRIALQQLLLTYHDRLACHIAGRFPANLNGLIDVDDVLHRTYVKVFRTIAAFEQRSPQSFYAWLKTIVTHQLYDVAKSRGRERLVADRAPEARDASQASRMAPLVERLAEDRDTPSRGAARGEAVRNVQAALASLPDDYRQAVQLRYLQGLSLEETAQVMDRSPDAVRGLCHRAKKRLCELLGRPSFYFSG
jgi:RNA polymerase sigma-70 factor (ECF subfamily)